MCVRGARSVMIVAYSSQQNIAWICTGLLPLRLHNMPTTVAFSHALRFAHIVYMRALHRAGLYRAQGRFNASLHDYIAALVLLKEGHDTLAHRLHGSALTRLSTTRNTSMYSHRGDSRDITNNGNAEGTSGSQAGRARGKEGGVLTSSAVMVAGGVIGSTEGSDLHRGGQDSNATQRSPTCAPVHIHVDMGLLDRLNGCLYDQSRVPPEVWQQVVQSVSDNLNSSTRTTTHRSGILSSDADTVMKAKTDTVRSSCRGSTTDGTERCTVKDALPVLADTNPTDNLTASVNGHFSLKGGEKEGKRLV